MLIAGRGASDAELIPLGVPSTTFFVANCFVIRSFVSIRSILTSEHM